MVRFGSAPFQFRSIPSRSGTGSGHVWFNGLETSINTEKIQDLKLDNYFDLFICLLVGGLQAAWEGAYGSLDFKTKSTVLGTLRIKLIVSP